MLTFLSKYANQNRLYGFITNQMNDSFMFIIMDSITEKIVTYLPYQTKDVKVFVDQFSLFGNNLFKAIIVDLLKLPSEPWQIGYNVCEELRKKLNELEIPSYFIPNETYIFTSLLIAAQVDVGVDETVLIVMPCMPSSAILSLLIVELKFTPAGYQQIRQTILPYDPKINSKTFFQQICGDSNPQKIVVSAFQCKKIPFKKIFKPKICSILLCGNDFYREKFIVESCKWLLQKRYIKYHIIQNCAKSIHVWGKYGPADECLKILDINENDPLPISKTVTFTRCVPELFVFHENKHTLFVQKVKTLKNCHGHEIIVTIDEENFDDINLGAYSFTAVEGLPSKMDDLLEPKIPFIAFYENSSVIGIYNKEKEEYEFLDEWNGIYGRDCFISFDEKKPKFGEEAMDTIKTKNTFVVFDLLKIMSMEPDNIKIDKTWGFTFTSDANNPVLLEFDNFDDTKKASSPSFLMAMYLRQHLKAIEAKVGEKPKEIGVWFLNEFEGFEEELDDDEMDRIKDGLKESCRLLKLNAYFVNIECSEIEFVKYCPKNCIYSF